jgi:RNA polymerase sigma-70 factor (ECF subfamily)
LWDKNIEDLKIIQKILSGDKNLYREIINKYQQKVRTYCFNFLSDKDLADDTAQEIFLKAYQGLKSFKGQSSFSTWLFRITFNHCSDVLRKRNKQNLISLEGLIEKEGDKIEALLFTSEDHTLVIEEEELLRQLISAFPERYRTILILREVNELSYEEIADILHCSIDSVKGRLKRARKEVAKQVRHLTEPINV